MLRGMGWIEPPEKKKTGNLADDTPLLRPKGMGLGADKALKPNPLLIPPEANEKLEIKKHAFVRIMAGKHKDAYGQIEGFDDEHSRVIVKMAIGGAKESFNEFLCQPISRKEFAEYGKCINSTKYEQYKRLEEKEQIHKIKREIKEEYASGSKYTNNNQRVLACERSKDSRQTNGIEIDFRLKQQRHEKRRSRSVTPKHSRSRPRAYSSDKQTNDSSESSEDSDSAYEQSSLHGKKSKKRKKSTKRAKNKRKSHKKDESDNSSNERKAAKLHKKKTKKSKKPRSRSCSNSRERR